MPTDAELYKTDPYKKARAEAAPYAWITPRLLTVVFLSGFVVTLIFNGI